MKVPFNNRYKHNRKTDSKKTKTEKEEAVLIENNLEDGFYDTIE